MSNRKKNYNDKSEESIIKNDLDWYSPDSGLWGERYMDEKKDVLTDDRNKKEIRIIKRYLIDVGDVLDIPCGYGRISNTLAKDGYRVTGVDNNQFFLDIAQNEADRERLDVEYVNENMINYEPGKQFDAVLNIFTSVGYFNSEKKNTDALIKMSDLVKTNGVLIVELMNPIKLLKNFQKNIYKTTAKGTKIEFENFFDPKTSVNTTVITEKFKNGETNKVYSRIRLYYPHELINIYQNAGMNLLALLDKNGDEKDVSESLRMYLIFKKIL